jgi:hypothetical protein
VVCGGVGGLCEVFAVGAKCAFLAGRFGAGLSPRDFERCKRLLPLSNRSGLSITGTCPDL